MWFLVAGLALLAACALPGLPLFSARSGTESHLDRAEAYQKRGRYFEALSFYNDIALNTWSEQASAAFYCGLADIYHTYLGNREGAVRLYKELLSRFPHDACIPAVYHRLAKIYYEQGKRDESLSAYRDILTSFPRYYQQARIDAELQDMEARGVFLDDVVLTIERPLPAYTRVLLADGPEQAVLSSGGGLGVLAQTSSLFKKTAPGTAARFYARNDCIVWQGHGDIRPPVRVKSLDGSFISCNGALYRGFFWLSCENGNLQVINHLPLEEYLYGVLPREVPALWPQDALKAQAVAARTYVLYHMVKRAQDPYDVFSTTASQVYGGRDAENTKARQAVDLTQGMILAYNNKIVLALYHANSGGQTEMAQRVWGSPVVPYLGGRKDPFSLDRPGFDWHCELSIKAIRESMIRFGLPVTTIRDLVPMERAPTGRISRIKIDQPGQPFFLTGNSFRLIVGPGIIKSTNFTLKGKNKSLVFRGKGYGHGVGMSQWGAYGMAKQGYTFDDILKFYYPGTDIVYREFL